MITRDAFSLEGARVIDGLLQVNSRSESSEEFEAKRGRSFVIHYQTRLKALSEGGLIYIKNNDPSFNMHITRIYIDPFTLTDTDLIMTQVFDPTITGGEDVSSSALIQKNTSKGDTFPLSILASSATEQMTFLNGKEYHSFPISSRQSLQRNMNGTNIISLNKGVLWGFQTESGSNATADEIISLSINITKVSA